MLRGYRGPVTEMQYDGKGIGHLYEVLTNKDCRSKPLLPSFYILYLGHKDISNMKGPILNAALHCNS